MNFSTFYVEAMSWNARSSAITLWNHCEHARHHEDHYRDILNEIGFVVNNYILTC